MTKRTENKRRFRLFTRSRKQSVQKQRSLSDRHDADEASPPNIHVVKPAPPRRGQNKSEVPSITPRGEYFLKLEQQLGELAYAWRSAVAKEVDDSEIVAQYQRLLRQMVAEGFGGPLDIDAELPDDLMPDEYLKLHR